MLELDQTESWLIALMAIFGIFWSLAIIPLLPHLTLWTDLNPFWQYLIFNIGFLLMFISIVGVGFGFIIKHQLDFFYAIRSGIASFILFAGFDLWQPPFAYNSCGYLLASNVSALSGAAVDRMLGFVFENTVPFLVNIRIELFGLCLGLEYAFIYFIVPIVGLIVIALLFAGKDFVSTVFSKFGQ